MTRARSLFSIRFKPKWYLSFVLDAFPLPMECDTETMNELNMLGAVTQYIFPRAPPGGNSLGKANPGVWSLSYLLLHADKLPKGKKNFDPIS